MMINFLKLLPLKKQYSKAVIEEISKNTSGNNKQQCIAALPAVFQKYVGDCGYNHHDRYEYCNIKWKSAHLKMAPDKKWLRTVCDQVNFINHPARIVYLKTKLWGLFPVEAIDKFQNGKGNMVVRLLKYFTITNAKGPKIDAAALVTILAEAMIVPVYFFQPYITWTEINPFTIKGTIIYSNIEASGIFYFNGYSELLRFETYDRYYNHNGRLDKFKWTVFAWNYKLLGSYKYPSNFMAMWSLPEGEYSYFKCRLDRLNYS
jgi:hypothetical protein